MQILRQLARRTGRIFPATATVAEVIEAANSCNCTIEQDIRTAELRLQERQRIARDAMGDLLCTHPASSFVYSPAPTVLRGGV